MHSIPLKEQLEELFVGKSIKDVQTPAAVLDLHKVQSNCKRMLEAVSSLNIGWRVHLKTHKTTELTRLQVGEGSGPVKIIVSTIVEAENILPLLLSYRSQGRAVNILHSFPVAPSAVARLSSLSTSLGPGGLSLMIDHPAQLACVVAIATNTGHPPSIFIKLDIGAHRAGVVPQSESASKLLATVLSVEATGHAKLLGLYSHAGHSYSSTSRAVALDYLRQELEALFVTAGSVHASIPGKRLILSAGATPTTTSVRNLLIDSMDTPEEEAKEIAAVRATMDAILAINCSIEIHAGVYPVLDVQQLATHALPSEGPHAMLTWDNLALTIVAEIASIYPRRGQHGSDEMLINAGTLALGREPCKAYPGWGVVSPWNIPGENMPASGPEALEGWRVGRISQEHGILTWSGRDESRAGFEVGQKIRVWPNHACIAGAGFEWYLIVDSGRVGREDEIVEVWPRWRGW